MTTPYRRHQERVRKEQEAAAAATAIAEKRAPEPLADVADTMAALTLNLENDLARLSGLAVGDRIELKAELLPGYLAAVNAYLDDGDVYANPVMAHMIIWIFDLIEAGHSAGDIITAERLAMAAVDQGQHMPERFNRDLPTFVADAFLAWAKLEIDQNHSPEPIFSRVFEQVKTWPVPQVVLMKYHKAAANIAIDKDDDQIAYGHLIEAQKLGTAKHPAKISTALASVKKRLEKAGQLQPAIDKQPTPSPEHDAPDTDEPGTDTQPE